ncbi:MAG: hypothetical protein GXP55_03210, partial [Deltaproteobacteria bacterium]|nr:hypothetical protein [Deltaproteobacteria bacterium]
MRRLSRLLVLAGALLLPTSCGDGCSSEAPPALDTGTPAAHHVPPAPVPRERVPFARVTRVEGQGASVRAGAALEPGAVL